MTSESGRQPLSPVKRKRLQQMFEHASKNAAQGQYDYATVLLTNCVVGDPGNVIYTRAFLDNLFKKYNNNKKGSKLAGMAGIGAQGSIKKASMSKDWTGVITAGLEMLKLNPWHIGALTQMAAACEELQLDDCQLAYLKSALDANSKDPDTNRLCGRALARQGAFDQAISCWHRVEQAKPGDEEAQRAIADLAVEKTITRGGYDDAETSQQVMAEKAGEREGAVQLTPEQALEAAIKKAPADMTNYIELAEIHSRLDRFEDAEAVLKRALDASGAELGIRERLEDTQLRRSRQQVQIAERRAETEGKDGVELAKKMRQELNRLETDIYRSRADRYPTNLKLKYELGLRLKRGGQYSEAIQNLQLARADSKLAADVYLELGECFYHIKQYKLSLGSYGTAVETIPDRDLEKRKLALYRCGTLAYVMKDIDLAEKHLTDVASLDFGYKDVAKWLEKIAQARNNGDH
jgi:tetratricopeptide (TPR) repeat protein